MVTRPSWSAITTRREPHATVHALDHNAPLPVAPAADAHPLTNASLTRHFAWPLPAIGDSAYPNWFRLKTNYDHAETPPDADARRGYGYRFMDEVGAQGKVDGDLLWSDVITQWPIYKYVDPAAASPTHGAPFSHVFFGRPSLRFHRTFLPS